MSDVKAIFKITKADFFIGAKKNTMTQSMEANNKGDNISVTFRERIVLFELPNQERTKLPIFSGFLYNKSTLCGFILTQTNNESNLLKSVPRQLLEKIGLDIVGKVRIPIGRFWHKEVEKGFTRFIDSRGKDLDEVKIFSKSRIRFIKNVLENATRNIELTIEEEELVEKIDGIDVGEVISYLPDYETKYKKTDFVQLDESNIIFDVKNQVPNISGTPFQAVYNHYLNKKDTFEFFAKNYGYQLEEDIEEIIRVQVDEDTQIVFNAKDVDLIKSTPKKEYVIKILNTGIKILGWYQTQIKGEYKLEEDNIYFIIEKIENKQIIHLSYHANKIGFNNKNGGQGIRFMGKDDELSYFWDALEIMIKEKKIERFYVIENNGLNLEYELFSHGGEIIYKNVNNKYINLARKYAVNFKNRADISIVDFYEQLKEIYNHEVVIVVLLWRLGAMMKPLFNKYDQWIPLMFAAGKTKAGKNTLIEIIMNALGYRTKMVGQGCSELKILSLEGTTQQPLMHALRDNTPIFLDELTLNIKQGIEETLKGAFNNATVKKGRLGGNEYYELNSPICVAGERLPKNLSVLNRGIMVRFREEYKLLEADQIYKFNDLQEFNILDNVWEVINDNLHTDNIPNYIKDSKLISIDREARSWNFISIVNKIFKVIDDEELQKIIYKHYQHQIKVLLIKDEVMTYLEQLIIANIQLNLLKAYYKGDSLMLRLYSGALRDYEEKTMYFMDVAEMFENEGNTLIIDMDKLRKDAAMNNSKKVIFNSIVRFLESLKDHVIENRLAETVGLYNDSDIPF